MKKFRDSIAHSLAGYFSGLYNESQITRLIERPKNSSLGDLSLPVFSIAKNDYGGVNPNDVASDIANALEVDKRLVESVGAVGGYVNFRLNDNALVRSVLGSVLEEKNNYGRNDKGKGQFVVVEYSSPNIGKTMHVGHIRSTVVGESVARILDFAGYKTHRINYLGDTGLHVGKIIAAYNRWGDREAIENDPQTQLTRLYTEFCRQEREAEKSGRVLPNVALEEEEFSENNPWTTEAKQLLAKLEAGDPGLVKLANDIYDWSMPGFNRMYDLLDVKFDEVVGQGKFTDKGKQVVQAALDRGVAYRGDDNAIRAMLSNYKLPDKVLLRPDGTAIYSTQDLGAAVSRYERFKFNQMLYVVGDEQKTYFNQIFRTLESAGYDWAKKCRHISFGHLRLPEGGMSTRSGNVIPLEEVLDRVVALARENIEKRNPNLQGKDEVARMVGIGAIKYMILSVETAKNISFSLKRALDFDGNSSPYIQYAHARASGILRKTGASDPVDFKAEDLKMPQELDLVRKIGQFELLTDWIADNPAPNAVAEYANSLASIFTTMYHDVKIIGSNEQNSRLTLVNAFCQTARNSLGLLGIGAPGEM